MNALIAQSEYKRLHGIVSTRILRGVREFVGRCENCGSTDNLTCHHVIKVAHNGTDYADNLVVLCWDCHEVLHWLEEMENR